MTRVQWHMCPYVRERLCATCFLFDPRRSLLGGEAPHRASPPWEERTCASNHHVHRLPVTLPYAPAVGLLITSVCDSRTAKVVRRRLGGGGWREVEDGGRRRRVNCLLSCERMSVSVRHGEEGNFVVTPAWFHCDRESGCLSSHLLPSLSFHD